MTKTTEANPELTKADEYRRELSADLAEATREFNSAHSSWEELKDETKEAKAAVELAQRRMNRIANELRDVEIGQYQPKLLDAKPAVAGGEVSSEDDGAIMSIMTLDAHGLTRHQCELMRDSELEIETIGDLEAVMRADEWWQTKVKGMGEASVDKVTDALFDFRRLHPVPSEDDKEESNPPAIDPSAEPAENAEL